MTPFFSILAARYFSPPDAPLYIDNLKKVLGGIPETEGEELKHEKIDEDFGLLELATNAGRDTKEEQEYCILFTVFATLVYSWVLIGYD
jgi:hypothetical protein